MLMLAVIVVVIPQYSDYRARAQTDFWLLQLGATKQAIAAKAISAGALSASGMGVPVPVIKGKNQPDLAEVRPDGVIFLQGGIDGQFVAVIPSLQGGGVTWRCIGGSAVAVRRQCRVAS